MIEIGDNSEVGPENPRVFPASIIQRQFWLLNQVHPDNPTYNEPLIFRLNGRLNIPTLKRGLNEIICRHDVFRTIYRVFNGELYQEVIPEVALGIPVIHLKPQTESELDIQIRRAILDEIREPFDLSKGPLVRLQLIHVA